MDWPTVSTHRCILPAAPAKTSSHSPHSRPGSYRPTEFIPMEGSSVIPARNLYDSYMAGAKLE